jgi:hypothetical protein
MSTQGSERSERRISVPVTCPNCLTRFEVALLVPEAQPARGPSPPDPLALFPEELRPLLRVQDAGDRLIVKPTKWLGKERFNAAMAVVRQRGGEYVPAGKDSHFSIPKG